ncbi:MAG TPA: response regulator [Vicinamibacterales bacterium]|nr:response regulator [Vicinamibacterales bacterium]
MGPYAFTQAFLCGFFSFSAVAAFVMWSRTRRDRNLPILAIGSCLWAVQSLAVLLVAIAETNVAAQRALDLRTMFGSLGVAATAWLFAEITGVRARAFVWAVTISMTAVAIATASGAHLVGEVTHVARVTLPWGESFGAPMRSGYHPIAVPIYGLILSVTTFTVFSSYRYARHDRLGGVLLMTGALGLGMAVVSAALIDLLRIQWPYPGMLAIALAIVVIALQFARVNRQRDEDLVAADRRFRAIFDQTFQFIGLLSVDGTLLEANATALRFAAVGEDEVIGKKFWDTPWWNHSPELQDRLRAAVETAARGTAVRFEVAHPAPDGQMHQIDFSLKPVRDARGNIVMLIPEGHDIQDRVTAEEAKRKLEQQLLQSQKMEALGQLAGGIAHDFNNLLTVIAGHADMLIADQRASGRHDLDQIRIACERGASMTRQLLAFSRQSVFEPKIVDVNSVVAQTETMLRRTIGEQIELTVHVGADVRLVRADPDQLSRVLMNMAINARDAMPDGGRLGIETRNVTAPDRNGGQPMPGEYVLLAMSDTGCGIPDESRARLFEPFFTTKPQGKGTGLGLAVAGGIVKQSGGWIDVESEVGVGTTFQIYLPAASDAAVETVRALEGPPTRGPETVLLVEDETAVRDMARTALESYGYTVLTASNGEDAWRTVAARRGNVDLLLTDVIMPGMSGPELADRVRREYAAIAVIFMSGYTSDAVLRQGVHAGEANFVQKPFNTAALATKLRQVLDRR